MPELPEVETIKNDLNTFILAKKITRINIRLARLIKSDLGEFKKILKNNSFKKISRRGKLLIFSLKKNPDLFLLIHLRMTGQLVYCQKKPLLAGGHGLPLIKNCLPSKYSYVIFDFANNSKLFFNDLRTFGVLKLVDDKELKSILRKFGIEPGKKNWTLANLTAIIKNRRLKIKPLLLNQGLISGIGNIYADEILFRAGIRPNKESGKLKNSEIKKIFNSALIILRQAIRCRGTTFNNYVDTQGKSGSFIKRLKVYGRGGKKCFKCQTKLKKIKLAGRGTVFCQKCQK